MPDGMSTHDRVKIGQKSHLSEKFQGFARASWNDFQSSISLWNFFSFQVSKKLVTFVTFVTSYDFQSVNNVLVL